MESLVEWDLLVTAHADTMKYHHLTQLEKSYTSIMSSESNTDVKEEACMFYMRRALKMLRQVWICVASWVHLIWLYLAVTGHFFVWRIHIWLHSWYSRGSIQLRMKQTLLLIRHGETTWNREHRLPGQLPGIALTEEGRRQAASLAEALKVFPISTVVSSPLERARETAQYLISTRNLELQFEPDLMDTNVGRWSGQVFEDLLKSDPAWKAYLSDPTVAPDGIETFPQVQQRVVAAVERWCTRENVGSYLTFVAHADVIKLLLAHYMRLDVRRAVSLVIDNASVSVVQMGKEGHLRVVAIGWTPRPGWLKPPLSEPERGDSGRTRTGASPVPTAPGRPLSAPTEEEEKTNLVQEASHTNLHSAVSISNDPLP